MSFESTNSEMGRMDLKEVQVSRKIIFQGDASDDHQTTLLCNNPSASYNLIIPTLAANQTVLHNGSALSAGKVAIPGLLAETAPQDDDLIMVYDDSTSTNKKVTIANLRAAVEHEHSGSSGQIEISDGTSFSAQTVSGDASLAANGTFTLAAKPDAAGTAQASKFLQLGALKQASGLGAVGAVSVVASAAVQGAQVAIEANKWRFAVNSSTNALEMQWYTGSSWVTRFSFNAGS